MFNFCRSYIARVWELSEAVYCSWLKIMTSRRNFRETGKREDDPRVLEKSKRDPDIIRRDRMCAAHERNLLISRHEKESTRSATWQKMDQDMTRAILLWLKSGCSFQTKAILTFPTVIWTITYLNLMSYSITHIIFLLFLSHILSCGYFKDFILISFFKFTCSINVEQQLCGMLIRWSDQSLDDLIPQHFNWNELSLVKMRSMGLKKIWCCGYEINKYLSSYVSMSVVPCFCGPIQRLIIFHRIDHVISNLFRNHVEKWNIHAQGYKYSTESDRLAH